LNLTDDRAEKTRRKKPRPEGTRRVLTDRGQLSQGGSNGRGHTAKLPANLVADSVRPVGGRQAGGLGGICGGTKGVRAHVRDACGLPCCSGGSRRGSAHVTSGASSNEATADLLCDAKLATRKRPCPCDGIARAAVLRSLRLKQSPHPLRAVRRPSCDNPPVSFAQRLRRTHIETLPRVSMPRRDDERRRPAETPDHRFEQLRYAPTEDPERRCGGPFAGSGPVADRSQIRQSGSPIASCRAWSVWSMNE
jgi:hypothetical protein